MSTRLKDNALVRLLGPLLSAHRFKLLVVLAMMPISSVLAALVPYLTKVAIDSYIVPAAQTGVLETVYQPLLNLVGLAALVVVGGYLADAVYLSILQRVGQGVIAQLRDTVYARTLRLPRAYFDTHPIGTVLTRVTSDIEALGETLATGSVSMLVDILKTLAFLAMMFALDWRLTLVLLLIIPVLVLMIAFFQARVRSSFFLARQALSEATGYLQECLSGIKTVQLYGAEQLAVRNFAQRNKRHYRAQNASNLYDALLFSLVEGVTTLALALMLWYSAGELLSGLLTLGVLVAFMEYIQRMFVPVREFTQQIAVLQRAMAALDHISELVQVPLDPAEVEQPGQQGWEDGAFQSLQFENVRYRYRAEGPEILKGISFSLSRGKTLAIVGATGSGKSTLLRLLTRAYDGYEGSIRINGVELREISAARLSSLISMVHQNVFLYRGSVAFNIGMDREGITPLQIETASRYVNAHGFVHRLEGGYDFEIVQGGANLSAGEGQLIALARAVVAEAEMIVLDEATSSVDSVTESLIQQAVSKLYADKTVIAVAHRLSTIRSADTILVLDAGQIAEAGSHEQLLRQGGLYAALVGEMQGEGAGG
ncbi:MAG: ABC transporter ATP-binding protein [SAR324 cluster bacterium]|nr:ABC transporter ATP-binding protein [SAR324 cluster bacterium]MCZ6627294.1 ABC transporter ATP-binding protein [SAR324 cluster bacterium]